MHYSPYGYGMMNQVEPPSRRGRGRGRGGPQPLMHGNFPRGNQMRWGSAFASLRGQAPEPFYEDYGGDYGYDDFGGQDGPEEPPALHTLTPSGVKDWLTMQHPVVIREVMFHCK